MIVGLLYVALTRIRYDTLTPPALFNMISLEMRRVSPIEGYGRVYASMRAELLRSGFPFSGGRRGWMRMGACTRRGGDLSLFSDV